MIYTIEEIINLRKLSDVDFPSIRRRWMTRFRQYSGAPLTMYESIKVMELYLPQPEMIPFKLFFLNANVTAADSELNQQILDTLDQQLPTVRFLMAQMRRVNGKIDPKDRIRGRTDLEKLVGSVWTVEYDEMLADWLVEDAAAYPDQRQAHLTNAHKRLAKLYDEDPELVADRWSAVNLALFELDNKKTDFLLESLSAARAGLGYGPDKPFRLTMRILSILFHYPSPAVTDLFIQRLKLVAPAVWIFPLPQIIAYVGTDNKDIHACVDKLLWSVAKAHPDAIIYALLAPQESANAERVSHAKDIFGRIRNRFPRLGDEVATFSEEMLEVAATWWEMWQAGIMGIRNLDDLPGVVSTLKPLHARISKPPMCFYQVSFLGEWGAPLLLAERFLRNFEQSGDNIYFNQAWFIYRKLSNSLRSFVPSLTELSLADASPYLYSLRDSLIIIPGSFDATKPLLRIQSIVPTVAVMKSKQRPKRVEMLGTDGRKYPFLLKTNEDTRLDQRVMQLFDFISGAVAGSGIRYAARLAITTYQVIPFTSLGLIGWVENCDTVSNLVSKYREMVNESAKLEQEYYLSQIRPSSPDIQSIEKLRKVFDKCLSLSNTKGEEIAKILVMSSADSKDWLQRRLNYTASLASTSLAGYVLGLGDRHVGNIMMNMHTGKLVHIDYGDCFEVAAKRKDWPEQVPFRLTRMLVKALEVTGVEGTLLKCGTLYMKVIRAQKEQILGLLETFINDPLIYADPNAGPSTKEIMERINSKLTGTDSRGAGPDARAVAPKLQVTKLIHEAMDPDKLCQMFCGWTPYW
jgi:FKBP12-rapamycin complex-associated protein